MVQCSPAKQHRNKLQLVCSQ